MTEFIYLHGFASSPSSKKATAFKNKFKEMGISLEIPDLEGGDFENMTLTRQMNVLSECLGHSKNKRVFLIGSSMGAYLAVLAAQNSMNIHAVYLMAPGFNFMDRWMRKLNLDWHVAVARLTSVNAKRLATGNANGRVFYATVTDLAFMRVLNTLIGYLCNRRGA